MSPSSFAGNPLYLDPELLAEDGLLTPEEAQSAQYPGSPDRVDYAWLHKTRPAPVSYTHLTLPTIRSV